MTKNVSEVALDGVLEGTFVGEGSSEGTPKGLLWDLYKDAQEGTFEVEV